MKLLKKKPYITLLFAVSIILFVLFTSNTPGNITYKEIEINHGDSLWSLSEKYHGKMSTEKWIEIVMIENHLNHATIIAGKPLIIPLDKETDVFEGESFEVARDN